MTNWDGQTATHTWGIEHLAGTIDRHLVFRADPHLYLRQRQAHPSRRERWADRHLQH